MPSNAKAKEPKQTRPKRLKPTPKRATEYKNEGLVSGAGGLIGPGEGDRSAAFL